MVVRTRYWEGVKRAAVHYERQQWDLWAAEIKNTLGEEPETSYPGQLKQMFECFDFSVRCFVFERLDIWRTLGEQYRDAAFHHHRELEAFIDTLRTSGRLISIWRQINGLHEQLISTYHIWLPMLQLQYWKYQPSSLRDLMVSDKQFDELKPVYLTAFEFRAQQARVRRLVRNSSNGREAQTNR